MNKEGREGKRTGGGNGRWRRKQEGTRERRRGEKEAGAQRREGGGVRRPREKIGKAYEERRRVKRGWIGHEKRSKQKGREDGRGVRRRGKEEEV